MAAVLGCSAGMALSRDAHAQAACPVAALSAYSHNDYERPHPLEDALALGFRGVEVDLFLVDGELRIGHDRRAARSGGTLDSVYLAPLAALVDRCGPWGAVVDRPFLLALEIKEQSPATYDALMAVLRRYRHLWVRDEAGGTRVALDVVLVGWHPPPNGTRVDSLPGIQYRLSRAEPVDAAVLDPRVRLLSVDYGKTMGRWWRRSITRARWFDAIRASKAAVPDRLLRVHNVPQNADVYAALFAAGVDLIGTKQPESTAGLIRPSAR
ncbi:hypothetical protein [Gemmatimonas aurantiaca]|nr:hypothetical protein [Gemmatimonas aurantiaca]